MPESNECCSPGNNNRKTGQGATAIMQQSNKQKKITAATNQLLGNSREESLFMPEEGSKGSNAMQHNILSSADQLRDGTRRSLRG